MRPGGPLRPTSTRADVDLEVEPQGERDAERLVFRTIERHRPERKRKSARTDNCQSQAHRLTLRHSGEATMSDNVDNIIIEHLRAIRGDIAGLSTKIDTLVLRVHSLEDHVSTMRKDLANLHGDIMLTHGRLDQINERVEHIEKRLDLTHA